jgi:hypothetical protein
MASLQDLQAPLDLAIVFGVMDELPEHWLAFQLEVCGAATRAPGELVFSISSPEGYPPVALEPDSAVFVRGIELDELFHQFGAVFSTVLYTAEVVGKDLQWKASYSYYGGAPLS